MNKKKIWIVVGRVGPIRCFCGSRREARAEAKDRNDGPYTWKPYRVFAAVVAWKESR